MKEDGDHASAAAFQGPRRTHLKKALGANEVGLKRRPERIAPPSHAVDVGTALAQQGIVKGDDYGSLPRESRKDLLKYRGKESAYISASFAVETIVGAPVMLLTAAGADEIGKGGPLRAEQNGEHVLAQALGATIS